MGVMAVISPISFFPLVRYADDIYTQRFLLPFFSRRERRLAVSAATLFQVYLMHLTVARSLNSNIPIGVWVVIIVQISVLA